MIIFDYISQKTQHEHMLCFVHIPKTAGSSFTDILRSIIGQNDFRVLLPDVLNGIKEADLNINSYNGISGHFPYEISKLILKPTLFLTFLRDPISRSLSYFKHIQSTNLDYPWIQKSENFKFFKQVRQMSFQDFIETPFFIRDVANLQTRMLGLSIDHTINQLSELMPIDHSKDRLFSIQLAKERLESFTFIGLQEKFQESMDVFSFQFGVHPIKKPPTINISLDQNQVFNISEQTKEKLINLNNLDIELYGFGQRLFAKRYREMMSWLHEERQYDVGMSIYEMLSAEFYKKNRIIKFPYRYEFENIYTRTGWYLVEKIRENLWAWSGPGTTSTIDLPLDRQRNLLIRFKIAHYITLDILESLELRIDEQRIHLINIIKDGTNIFIGIIPTNLDKKHFSSHLSFHVNRTAYPPGMTAETPGARLLGFALSWIEITPLE